MFSLRCWFCIQLNRNSILQFFSKTKFAKFFANGKLYNFKRRFTSFHVIMPIKKEKRATDVACGDSQNSTEHGFTLYSYKQKAFTNRCLN